MARSITSPSIWWNDRAVLAGEADVARRVETGEIEPRVLVTIGAFEQDPPKVPPPGMTAEAVAELVAEGRMVENALELGGDDVKPDPVLAIDLTIGLGAAQRQTGDPAYRETLLHAARRAVDSGETSRLVKAALANDRGFYSAVGAIDGTAVLPPSTSTTATAAAANTAAVTATHISARVGFLIVPGTTR